MEAHNGCGGFGLIKGERAHSGNEIHCTCSTRVGQFQKFERRKRWNETTMVELDRIDAQMNSTSFARVYFIVMQFNREFSVFSGRVPGQFEQSIKIRH